MLVSGRVQGVWFRESCRREAEALGVAGWVRNRADGRVEVEVEGEAEPVERLVGWARVGPSRAQIDAVETTALDPTGEAGFFVV